MVSWTHLLCTHHPKNLVFYQWKRKTFFFNGLKIISLKIEILIKSISIANPRGCVLYILTNFQVLRAPKLVKTFYKFHFQTFFLDCICEITERGLKWTKKVENGSKKCFEIHNRCVHKQVCQRKSGLWFYPSALFRFFYEAYYKVAKFYPLWCMLWNIMAYLIAAPTIV